MATILGNGSKAYYGLGSRVREPGSKCVDWRNEDVWDSSRKYVAWEILTFLEQLLQPSETQEEGFDTPRVDQPHA